MTYRKARLSNHVHSNKICILADFSVTNKKQSKDILGLFSVEPWEKSESPGLSNEKSYKRTDVDGKFVKDRI